MESIKLKNSIISMIEEYETEGRNKSIDAYWTDQGLAPSFVSKYKDNKDTEEFIKFMSCIKPSYNVGKEILRVIALVKYKFSIIDELAIDKKSEAMLLELLSEVENEFNDLFEDPDGYGIGTIREIKSKISIIFNSLNYENDKSSVILFTSNEKNANLNNLRSLVYTYFINIISFSIEYSDLIIEVYFSDYKNVVHQFGEVNAQYGLFCTEDDGDIPVEFFNKVELAIEYANMLNKTITDKEFLQRMKYSPYYGSHSSLRKLLRFEEKIYPNSIYTTKLYMYLMLASLDDDIPDVNRYAKKGVEGATTNYLKRDILLFLGLAINDQKFIVDAIEIEKELWLFNEYKNKQNNIALNINYAKEHLISRLIFSNIKTESCNINIYYYILETHHKENNFSIENLKARIASLDKNTCYLEYFNLRRYENTTFSLSPYDESEYYLVLVSFIGGDVSSLKIETLGDNRDNFLRKISYYRSLVTKVIKPESRYTYVSLNIEDQRIQAVGPVSEDSDSEVTRHAGKVERLIIPTGVNFNDLVNLGINKLKIFSNFDINRMPFEVLPIRNDGSVSFLGTQFECSYGIEPSIIKPTYESKNNRKTKSIVIAHPDFNARLESEEKIHIDEVFSYFPIIKESKKEGEIVSQLIDAKTIFDNDVTKEIIMSLDNPHILHISSHSFWKDTFIHVPISKSTRANERMQYLIKPDENKFNHGLALSGCNLNLEISDTGTVFNKNGFLTINDIKQLNIKNTSLVFISSCDSAIGDVDNDNNFESISAAFLKAGAKSVIGNLWKIPDITAREFVSIFYDNYKKGLTVSKSMQITKILMQKKGYEQEDWGSYVLYGSTETKYGQ